MAWEVELKVAREAAAFAAERIALHANAAVDVEYKDDDSPVTRADKDAERAIRETIAATFPNDAIYGEEEGHDSGGDGKRLWLVDPLDGTKSFVRNCPVYSTQIALMVDGKVVVGVSHAPHFGESMWASAGGGAFSDSGRAAVSEELPLSRAILSTGNVGSLSAVPAKWSALGQLMRDVHRHRGYGDFLHYHWLARGVLDAVVESDVNILDVAALSCIVAEAGGQMSTLDGQGLSLTSTTVCAASHPGLAHEIRQRLQEV